MIASRRYFEQGVVLWRIDASRNGKDPPVKMVSPNGFDLRRASRDEPAKNKDQ